MNEDQAQVIKGFLLILGCTNVRLVLTNSSPPWYKVMYDWNGVERTAHLYTTLEELLYLKADSK